jgi:hypothetical protein
MPEFGSGWGVPDAPTPYIPDSGVSGRRSASPPALRRQFEQAAKELEQIERRRAEEAERRRRAEEAEGRRRAEEAERSEEHPESRVSSAADKPSDLASKEGVAFVEDSCMAFAQFFAQGFADVHGFGLAFRVAKWVYGVSKWACVAEGDGGVGVQAPLTVGPDMVLGVSVHIGGDPDTPPLTFCIAPSGESGVGAVSLGKLELDPENSHATAGTSRLEVSYEGPGAVELVPLRLSEGLPKDLDAAQAVGAARQLAEEDLLPRLRLGRQGLHDAGVDLVMGYDSAMGLAVWVDFSETDRSSEPVVTPVEDQLRVGFGSGVADLVISHAPGVGLTMSLQSGDDEEGSSPVLIRAEPAVQLEAAITSEDGTGSPESIIPAESPSPLASEGLSGPRVADVVSTPATQSIRQNAGVTNEGAAGSMAEAAAVRLTRVLAVPVPPEVMSWLQERGSLLSGLVGIDIELEPGGEATEKFATCIVGHEVATGRPVIIGYGSADQAYFGQILTHAAVIEATTIIWVAEEFGEEHRTVFDWLNAHTDRTMRFFGIRLAAVTLEGAPAGLIAPILELVVKPPSG